MSEDKRKRRKKELAVVLCVVAVLAVGVWYLKEHRQEWQTQSADSFAGEDTKTAEKSGDSTAVSETEDAAANEGADGEEENAVPSDEPTPSVQPSATPTPEPTLSAEEKAGGVYRGIDWAGEAGGRILICQMDSIEIRDSQGQTVQNFSDLGRIKGGSSSVYTNGFYAWFASSGEDGTGKIWRLDLESGEKQEFLTLGQQDTFVGANSRYFYYTVPGADEFENTLRAVRISDGAVTDIAQNVDEVTVLPEHVITMGLRFDVSPVKLDVYTADGSSSVTVGEYVNFYQTDGERILYLDYGSADGYTPSDLKTCGLDGQNVQTLAEDLEAISFSAAGDHTIYFSGGGQDGTSGTGYILFDFETGEYRTVYEGGSYLQFLAGDQEKIWLGKENQIIMYEQKSGQLHEGVYTVPEGSYAVGGFILDGRFYAVVKSSDNRVDVISEENF